MDCRKLLMHVAVDKGAAAGENFVSYVNYLEQNHFTPPGSRDRVDYIRQAGNEANHEIKTMHQQDAENLITFSAMILQFVYEFGQKIKPPPQPPAPPTS